LRTPSAAESGGQWLIGSDSSHIPERKLPDPHATHGAFDADRAIFAVGHDQGRCRFGDVEDGAVSLDLGEAQLQLRLKESIGERREIEEAAYRYQREIESEGRVIVGVNRYTSGGTDNPDIELHTVDETIRERQKERLAHLKEIRDNVAVEKSLAHLKDAAEGTENLLYPMKEALAELATLGEVSDALRGVFGEYRPS
jgi:hypothetical protein